MPQKPKIILLMGVSGSGKSTIGNLLSQKTGWPFFDGDDFHPAENIRKMSDGIPLTDQDRWPWLNILREKMLDELSAGRSSVFACSALRRTYREFLRAKIPEIKIIYLRGTRKLLLERLRHRSGHFMKKEMLASQLSTLEEPTNALTTDISKTPEAIVAEILESVMGNFKNFVKNILQRNDPRQTS